MKVNTHNHIFERVCHMAALAIFAILVLAGLNAAPARAQSGYTWKNVAVGGSLAMVTEVMANPAQQGLFYLRTDVGGAYKWDNVNLKWVQMMDAFTMDQRLYYSCEALAFDPNNVNVLYYAGGQDTAQGNGTTWKSTNQGTTWTQLSLSTPMGGNDDRRFCGERMQVSPSNSNVVLFGTRTAGLQRSTDGGTTWSTVSSIPIPSDIYGVQCVVFDPNTANLVYAGVNGHGVYKSTDNGATFTSIGGDTMPRRLKVGPTGQLWCTNSTAVSKYSGGSWTSYQPGGSQYYTALGLNPSNANEIIVKAGDAWSGASGDIYRTSNGGTSWSVEAFSLSSQVTWNNPASNYLPMDFAYDPFNTTSVWGSQWQTTNIGASTVAWLETEKGHEQIVNMALIAPPSGTELLEGMADTDGVALNNGLDNYASKQLGVVGGWQGHTWGMDYEESNPNNMVRVGAQGFYGPIQVTTSTNDGAAWNLLTFPANLYPMRCAMSCNNSSDIVVICNADYTTDSSGGSWTATPATNPWRYSTNGGSSWSVCGGLPTPPAPWGLWYDNQWVCADLVNGGTFYYHDLYSGKVYRSTDGGATWTWMNTGGGQLIPTANKQFNNLRAQPGVQGGLWISIDNDSTGPPTFNRTSDEGLYHSTDGGATWTHLATCTRAFMCCFGIAQSGSPATLFIYGRLPGDTSDFTYYSTNLGVSWTSAAIPSVTAGDVPEQMAASQQTFGRVFVGTGGRGVFYGSAGASAPSAPTGLTASPGNAQVALSWTASSGATSYNVLRSTVNGSGYASVATGISTTSYTNTGLTNGTAYYFVVTATNASGTSGNSNQASATPAAGSGSLSGSVAASPSTANLTTLGTTDWGHWGYNAAVPGWDHKSSGGTKISNYSTIGSGTLASNSGMATTYSWTDGTPDASESTTTGVTDSGLSNGFSITAPADTMQRTLTVYIGGYLGYGTLTAHLSDGSAGNYVDSSQGNATNGYNAYYTLTYKAASASQTLTVTWVTSTDDSGNGSCNASLQAAYLTVSGSAPAAPTGLTATPGNAQVALSWTASSGATSYNVLRSTVSGSGYASVATGISTTTYTNTGLTNGTTYYFVVTATNAGGTSGNSNQASATPAAGGGSLTGSVAASPSSANLTTLGTADWGHWGYNGAVPGWDHKSSGGTKISNYTAIGSGTLASNSGMITTYSWTNGTPDASESTTTGATDSGLNNGFSITVPADTTQRTLTVYIGGYLGYGTMTAHLSDSSASNYVDSSQGNATNGYNAYYTLTYKAASASQTLTVTWVTSTDDSGNGSCNCSLQAAYLTVASAPAAPTGLTATPGNAQVALSWTASSGATSYNVLRSTVSGSGYASVATGVSTTSYTNTGLTNGTAYYFAVTATNSGGTSGNSNQASAIPIDPNVHTGTWCCKAVMTTTETGRNCAQVVNCTANSSYVATCWIKGTGGTVLRVFAGNWGSLLSTLTCNATSTWRQFSVNVSTGSNTQLTYDFEDAVGVAGTIYIDDCFLGVANGTNTLANPGFESGNTGWGIDPTPLIYYIVQNP